MLDTDTKRRIDTARDILVGKVPDPKSQVEQITIALIYKFMDDMDAEAEELGGKRKFFSGDYARYGWAKLIRSGLGGHETLNLYAEAIAKMPENPGIPLLFRDIFKNAYLPYRDPETLRAFLKIIDEFTYDHSERLGDAFEYLLSVLGSQGDAGQFRTPRHIIDFIVDILDPKKTETVLDPACGTAGFLISSYKHILKANVDDKGHSTLTPDERGRLAANFKGYDISPDMVRLSLVNLYLHGFTDPHITEYDTLTSQDKWNEHADVILANPPFMSPKGGIKPHNRFSVQSKRSEVLFVDYMAEHLTPGGRAGIIVPEGIIFQSQTAYTQLRKMLVEEYLVAVVSLPAGVFNPYSGVKTSILILDRSVSKQASTIAFFKIENDGFGLGAQRREIAKNDLPQARAEIAEYLRRLRARESVEDFKLTLGLVVPKKKIAENSYYNLNGEMYREGNVKDHKFSVVKLGDVCSTASGGTPQSGNATYYEGGTIPWLRSGEVAQGEVHRSELFITEEGLRNSSAKLFPANTVVVAMYGATAGEVGILRFESSTNQAVCGITPGEQLVPEFLYLILRANKPALVRLAGGGAQPNISQKIIRELEIPLPPVEVQKEIVAEIAGYQKVIEGARAVLDTYRPQIPIHPDWPMVKLGTACIVNPKKSELNDLAGSTEVSFVPMSDLGEHAMFFKAGETKRLDEVTSSYTYFREGDVLVAKVTPCFENGKAGIARGLHNGIGFGSSEYYVLRPTDSILSEWVFLCVATPAFRAWAAPQMTGTGGLQRVPRSVVENYEIPLPSIETQEAIVAEIRAEQVLVAANRELVTRFEKKIKATLARVWGEEADPTPEEEA